MTKHMRLLAASITTLSVADVAQRYLFGGVDYETVAAIDGCEWPRHLIDGGNVTIGNRTASLLAHAAADGKVVWIEAMLKRGAQAWKGDHNGMPAAGFAAETGMLAAFVRLLKAPGICPAPSGNAGTTLVHLVLRQPDPMFGVILGEYLMEQHDALLATAFARRDTCGLTPIDIMLKHPHRVAFGKLEEFLKEGAGFCNTAGCEDTEKTTALTFRKKMWAMSGAPNPAVKWQA